MSKNIHFIGINGSGLVGVACLAKENGFNISGCDLSKKGNYSKQLEDLNIDVEVGQSPEHLKGIDKLVVSSAVFFKDKYKNIPEIMEALKQNIEITRWQDFLDKELAKNKDLICVSGTHGKTTTTTIVATMLDVLNSDPTVVIGGINKKWNKNYRNGKGKYFVCEADEYGNNFTYYHPKYIIINNIEMEHPEFFQDLEGYKQNFINFIRNIRDFGTIVFNGDDNNIVDILEKEKDYLKNKNIKLIAYITDENNRKNDNIKYNFLKFDNNEFILENKKYKTNDGLCGEHNFRNASVAILLLEELGFEYKNIYNCLLECELPKRRMEKVFVNDRFSVYDDYAHHHTQIFYNLKTLKNNINKNEKIIAVLEPHLISRYKENSEEYNKYMEIADYPIITKFFKSREIDLPDLDMKDYLNGTNIEYIIDFNEVVNRIKEIINIEKTKKMHIVIMGAGLSYKLTEKIIDLLKNKNLM
mgnify:CR=1 FL=1